MTWEMDQKIMEKRFFQQGEKSGKQKGEKIGERKKALEIAEALRKKGMSEAEIAEVTGLPEKKETLK